MDLTPSHRIHQLPEFEDAGYPPSIEYFLPVRDFPQTDNGGTRFAGTFSMA